MESEALGLGARNMYLDKILMLEVGKLWSTQKATQVPDNKGRRDGRELRMDTWGRHLQA